MLKDVFKPSRVKPCPYDPRYTKLCVVEIVEEGQLVTTSQFKESCISDNFGHLSASDYSLNNIIATGSLNMLNPVCFKNSDVTGLSDSLDNLLKSMSNA